MLGDSPRLEGTTRRSLSRARLAAIGLLVFLAAQTAIVVSAVACSGGGTKEPTTLTTSLSGEGKEGGEITILEGSKAKDKATLSGKNASEATGKVDYDVYSDSKCEHLVTAAGAVTVTSGSVPASSEEELEPGKTYYWQATYEGDSKNSASTSSCGSEVLKVKAKTSISTTLSDENKEGAELTAPESLKVKDQATLSGTNSSTATGKALYKIYSDSKCEDLVKEAGAVSVASGSMPASNEEELEGGKTYYWQVTYEGDGLHQESHSACGSETLVVKRAPAAPSTSCAITSEGVSFDAAVTASNESALIKDIINDTWVPVGESETKCKEIDSFTTAVSDSEITHAEEEEYETYLKELVVPGTYIYHFKWRETGGATFETLGVANEAITLQFEPLATWEVSSGEPAAEGKPVEGETEGAKSFEEDFIEPLKGYFGQATAVTTKLYITTPTKTTIGIHVSKVSIEKVKWPYLFIKASADITKEEVKTEGGEECFIVTVRMIFLAGFDFDYWVKATIGESAQIEPTLILCASGKYRVVR